MTILVCTVPARILDGEVASMVHRLIDPAHRGDRGSALCVGGRRSRARSFYEHLGLVLGYLQLEKNEAGFVCIFMLLGGRGDDYHYHPSITNTLYK